MALTRELKLCGMVYRVIEATPEEEATLADKEGETDSSSCTILIRAGQPPERQRDTYVHECLHALFEGSGVSELLVSGTRKRKDLEETMIRILTPHLIKAIDDNPNLWSMK